MPRIINAYDGNSALGESLAKLGESIYGDQAKNEVFRQKAFGQKNINDLATDVAVGLDDPRLAKAQLAIGGNASGTFAGLGRSLTNDRSIAGGHDAASIAVGRGNNDATRYGVDQRRLGDVETTGMNNASSERIGAGNNAASRDVGAGNNAATLEATRIQGENQHRTQMDIDGRTLTPVDDGNGGYRYELKSNAVGQGAPMTTDQVKAGVISQALRRTAQAQQPQAFPVAGAAPYNPAGAQPQPQQAAAAPQAQPQGGGDIFRHLTPQVRALVGVNTEQPMVDPRTGRTGISRDNGTTLDNGQPATGYMNTTQEGALAAEKANNVRSAAAVPLPELPKEYPQYAQDAYTAGGPGAAAQHDINAMSGLVGAGEVGAGTNRARENLTNVNNTVRSLYASAPGTRAAVYREKNADRALPEAGGLLGITGINADQQRNKAMSEIAHLKAQYELVQHDATDPNTPPEEAAKMLQWLHSARDAYTTLTKPAAPVAGAPTAGAQPAAAPAEKPPTVVQNGHTYNLQPDGSYQ